MFQHIGKEFKEKRVKTSDKGELILWQLYAGVKLI